MFSLFLKKFEQSFYQILSILLKYTKNGKKKKIKIKRVRKTYKTKVSFHNSLMYKLNVVSGKQCLRLFSKKCDYNLNPCRSDIYYVYL